MYTVYEKLYSIFLFKCGAHTRCRRLEWTIECFSHKRWYLTWNPTWRASTPDSVQCTNTHTNGTGWITWHADICWANSVRLSIAAGESIVPIAPVNSMVAGKILWQVNQSSIGPWRRRCRPRPITDFPKNSNPEKKTTVKRIKPVVNGALDLSRFK